MFQSHLLLPLLTCLALVTALASCSTTPEPDAGSARHAQDRQHARQHPPDAAHQSGDRGHEEHRDELPKVPPPNASAAKVAQGYRVEVVLSGLTYPTSVEFEDAGNMYVAEAGYAYGDPVAPARIWRISPTGHMQVVADSLSAPVNDLLTRWISAPHRHASRPAPPRPTPAGSAPAARPAARDPRPAWQAPAPAVRRGRRVARTTTVSRPSARPR